MAGRRRQVFNLKEYAMADNKSDKLMDKYNALIVKRERLTEEIREVKRALDKALDAERANAVLASMGINANVEIRTHEEDVNG